MRGFIETAGNHLRGSQGVLDFFLIFFPSLYILPFSPSTCRSHGSEATEMLMCHVVTTTSWLVSLEEEEKSRRTRRRP